MTEENAQPSEFIEVLIFRKADGTSRVDFRIEDLSEESDGDTASSEDQQSENTAAEKFARKASDSKEVARKLNRIGRNWTSVSIGFFEIVPELTQRNVSHLREGRTARLLEAARIVAVHETERETEEGERCIEFRVPILDSGLIFKTIGKSIQDARIAQILFRSALGALVSEYESYMGNMIRAIVRIDPRIVIPDDSTVEIREIENFASFDEFMEDLIESRVEQLLQSKSHLQTLKWLEEKFDVNLTSDGELISEFVEICQRRHLLAHAGGVVNKRYRKLCIDHGCDERNLPELNTEVKVDRQYLRRATARLFVLGFFTLHMLWQKLLPKHAEESRDLILSSSHDFLESDLTKMARRVCEFALKSNRHIQARTKAYLTINLAQSFLFDPSIEEEHRNNRVEAALRKHDWSMTTPTVDLALACLRREYGNLRELTVRACEEGLDFEAGMTWSIFREVREMPDFCEPINEHRRPKNLKELPVD